MYFVIKRAANNEYFFRVVGDNHEIICHSETYTTKQNAKNAIEVIKDGAANGNVHDFSDKS